MSYDLIIIGAGASGLSCAAVCLRRGRKVLLLDSAAVYARKLSVSGGGRCNFSNRFVSPESYVCANPHFAKSALARLTPENICESFAKLGLSYQEEEQGKLFCRQGAQAVSDALYHQALELGCKFAFKAQISGVRQAGAGFALNLNGEEISAPNLVVASGGPAWPQLGASDFGIRLAKSLGLECVQLRPGLTPFYSAPDWTAWGKNLSGLSLPVRLKLGKTLIEDELLFTHKGLSGPAALKASLFFKPGQSLSLDLVPNAEPFEILMQSPKLELHNALAQLLPRRLAQALAERYGLSGQVGAQSRKTLQTFCNDIKNFPFNPAGLGGFAKAEVSLGGVSTAELSSKTMQAQKLPGLYFIGEVMDVTGTLGGFNLHWAFASAQAAGSAI